MYSVQSSYVYSIDGFRSVHLSPTILYVNHLPRSSLNGCMVAYPLTIFPEVKTVSVYYKVELELAAGESSVDYGHTMASSRPITRVTVRIWTRDRLGTLGAVYKLSMDSSLQIIVFYLF